MTLVASDVRRPGEPLVAGTRTPRSVPARPIKAKGGENRGFGRWLLESGLYSLTLGYASPRSSEATSVGKMEESLKQRARAGDFACHDPPSPALPRDPRPVRARPTRRRPRPGPPLGPAQPLRALP